MAATAALNVYRTIAKPTDNDFKTGFRSHILPLPYCGLIFFYFWLWYTCELYHIIYFLKDTTLCQILNFIFFIISKQF